MPDNDSNSLSSPGPSAAPAVISIPVNLEIPAELLPLFTAIKKAYDASNSKVVGDCLRFALVTYQQGLVAPSDSLLDALINQMSAFKLLRERIEQSVAASHQACYVSSGIVKALENALAVRKNTTSTRG